MLNGCADSSVFRLEIADVSQYRKDEILYRGYSEAFIKHHRNADQVANDPENPVFNLAFGHQPHTHQENGGCKDIEPVGPVQMLKSGHGIFRNFVEQGFIIVDYCNQKKTYRKKNRRKEPFLFCSPRNIYMDIVF